MTNFQIPSNKHQIITKMLMTKIQKRGKDWVFVNLKIGNWNLFVIWDLDIGIFNCEMIYG